MPQYELRAGVPIFGTPDEPSVNQLLNGKDRFAHAALMADHHLGYSIPIGGVVAYHHAIPPAGVGYDIACGNKAVKLDADPNDIKKNIATVMDDIWRTIRFGIGKTNPEAPDHRVLETIDNCPITKVQELKDRARAQLGTVGSGNHYVDIFEAESDGAIWIGVHFGSRGFGWQLAAHYMQLAKQEDKECGNGPPLLTFKTGTAAEYMIAMELAGLYAYAGRDWVCQRVADIIGASIVDEVHNNHNFAWPEHHDGELLWVIRKGATPAFPGQRGFVGSSMSEPSVILEGIDSELSALTMYSTVHGAGRAISRKKAKEQLTWPYRELQQKQIEVRGGGLDEAPLAYKRLDDVLAAHEGTVRVLETLHPLGVAMAGKGE